MSPPARSQGRRQPDLFSPPEPPRQFDIAQAVRAIWHSSIDPSGTLTEKYLAQLGLTLPDDVRGRVIRHHGSLAFAKDKRMPGMLTLLRDFDGAAPVAVVRTFLTRMRARWRNGSWGQRSALLRSSIPANMPT